MENATKALLIAAAVLIVILLIAFGMRIFSSSSDVSGQATQTGQQISEQTQTAASTTTFMIYEQQFRNIMGKKLEDIKNNDKGRIIGKEANQIKNLKNNLSFEVKYQGSSVLDDNTYYNYTWSISNGVKTITFSVSN